MSAHATLDVASRQLRLVRGDDYPAGERTGIPAFTSSDWSCSPHVWPDLTGATRIILTIRERLLTGAEGAVLVAVEDTVELRVTGTGEQSVTFEPMSVDNAPEDGQTGSTDALVVGALSGVFDVEATLESGARRTLALGRVTVLRG